LEVADRVPKLLSILKIQNAILNCGTGEADCTRSRLNPCSIQHRLYQLETPRTWPRTDQILGRNAHPIEGQLPRCKSVIADLVERGAGQATGKGTSIFLYNDVGQTSGS